MKKLLIVLSLATLISITACDYNTVPRDNSREISGENFKVTGEKNDDIAILTDRTTGCQYLILGKDNFATGMANYLDENGKPVGCKGVK